MIKKSILIIVLISLCHNVAMAKTKESSNVYVVKKDWGSIWGDFLDNMFWPEGSKYEIGYTYSSIAPANTFFPVGFYGEWTYEWVAVSGELAANVSNKRYKIPKKEDETYKPSFYLMAGLGANINVLSLNFNAGIVGYGLYSTSTTDNITNTTSEQRYAAILQPSIHIHIPVDGFQHLISLKIGYNICPAKHNFNGLNIGIGFGGWYE